MLRFRFLLPNCLPFLFMSSSPPLPAYPMLSGTVCLVNMSVVNTSLLLTPVQLEVFGGGRDSCLSLPPQGYECLKG